MLEIDGDVCDISDPIVYFHVEEKLRDFTLQVLPGKARLVAICILILSRGMEIWEIWL